MLPNIRLRRFVSSPFTSRPRRRGAHRPVAAAERLEDRTLLSAGSLNPSFGTGGLVVTGFEPLGSSSDTAKAVSANLPDGKFLVAGTSQVSGYSGSVPSLARYNADGSLDTTFGTGGRLLLTTLESFHVEDMAVQADGKIVLAGTKWFGINSDDFTAVRLLADGRLDMSFGGGDGIANANFGNIDQANAIAIQSDGKIVLAGRTFAAANTTGFGVARFNVNGSLDATFGGDGTVIVDIGGVDGKWDEAHAVAVAPDGKIVLGGTTFFFDGRADDFAAARLNANGSLDTTFGGDGMVTVDIVGDYETAHAVLVQPDGKVVLVGHTYTPSAGSVWRAYDFAAVRLDTSGELDATFDGDGIVTVDFGLGWDYAYAAALQPDGKILLAGEASISTSDGFGVVRLTSDGSLDTSFDGDGRAFIDFGANFEQATAIALRPNGRVLVAGNVTPSGSSQDFGIAQLIAWEPLATDAATVTVAEGQTATNGGSVETAGAAQATISASVGTAVLNGDGTWSWSYAAPDGPVAARTVTIVVDVDGTRYLSTFRLVVTNVVPTLSDLALSGPIDEGQTAHLTGTVSDPGGDGFTLVVNWGDGTPPASSRYVFPPGTTSFDVEHVYKASGSFSVAVVSVTDDDGGQGSGVGPVGTIAVANVAPTIASFNVSAANGRATVTGSFTDPGLLDTHTVTIRWGDGPPTGGTVSQAADTFGGSHSYRSPGIYVVTVEVRDQDGAVDAATTRLFVGGVALSNRTLTVVGTDAADAVTIRQVGRKAPKIRVTAALSTGTVTRTYDPRLVGSIVVLAGGGNDSVRIDGRLRKNALIVGGDGDDRLTGGGGNDVILAGAGLDAASGGAGGDLLVGGPTAFDGNVAALKAIFAEWTAPRTFAARQANLTGRPGGLNRGAYLVVGTTVTDDGAADALAGGPGTNWLLSDEAPDDVEAAFAGLDAELLGGSP